MKDVPLIGVDEAPKEDDIPTVMFPFIGNQFHKDWKEVGGMLINHIAVELNQPESKLKPGFLIQVRVINKTKNDPTV